MADPEKPDDTATRAAKRRRAIGWPLVIGLALVAGAAFFALADVKKFRAIAVDVQPLWLLAAVVATVCAYLCFTGAFAAATKIAGQPRAFGPIVPTSFVSQAVNNLLSSGGLGGLAIRIYGLGQLGVPAGAATAVSAITTISNDVITALGLLLSIVYIINHSEDLSSRALYTLIALAFVAVGFVVGAITALRNPSVRGRIIDFIGRYAERLSAKLAKRGSAAMVSGSFREEMLAAFQSALAHPRRLVVPVAWMAFDVIFRVGCLWASFAAIGHPQPIRRVAAGFMIGISAGALSLVPGGIGVIEGSMAAVFSFVGVELEVAAVAVIVFRLAFYVMPLGAVALLFRPLLRGRSQLPPREQRA